MPSHYLFECTRTECEFRGTRYRNVRKCPDCGQRTLVRVPPEPLFELVIDAGQLYVGVVTDQFEPPLRGHLLTDGATSNRQFSGQIEDLLAQLTKLKHKARTEFERQALLKAKEGHTIGVDRST